MAEPEEDLLHDIFGGDDSDLSEDEEGVKQPQKQRKPSPGLPKGQDQDDDDDDDGDDADADAEDENEDSIDQRPSQSSKLPEPQDEEEDEEEDRFVSAPRQEKEKDSDEDEYDAGESEKRKPKEKKKKKRSAEEGEEERQKKKKKKQREPSPGAGSGGEEAAIELSEADRRRIMIDAKIDAAINQGKKKRPKKRAGEEDLDLLADDEVSALRADMITAAESDEASNLAKKPGTAKLKLLPQVVNTLQKTALQQSILDNNLLEGVKRWLEPLPDGSLPALNIQRQFFSILEKMQIDTISLKMSGLGKIVLFYSKCPRVETAIKRIAERLIETWSRPVLKRSSSYRDRHVGFANYDADLSYSGSQLSQSQSGGADRRNVSIPQAVQAGFKIAPKTSAGSGGSDASHQARLANHLRLNKFKKNLKTKR